MKKTIFISFLLLFSLGSYAINFKSSSSCVEYLFELSTNPKNVNADDIYEWFEASQKVTESFTAKELRSTAFSLGKLRKIIEFKMDETFLKLWLDDALNAFHELSIADFSAAVWGFSNFEIEETLLMPFYQRLFFISDDIFYATNTNDKMKLLFGLTQAKIRSSKEYHEFLFRIIRAILAKKIDKSLDDISIPNVLSGLSLLDLPMTQDLHDFYQVMLKHALENYPNLETASLSILFSSLPKLGLKMDDRMHEYIYDILRRIKKKMAKICPMTVYNILTSLVKFDFKKTNEYYDFLDILFQQMARKPLRFEERYTAFLIWAIASLRLEKTTHYKAFVSHLINSAKDNIHKMNSYYLTHLAWGLVYIEPDSHPSIIKLINDIEKKFKSFQENLSMNNISFFLWSIIHLHYNYLPNVVMNFQDFVPSLKVDLLEKEDCHVIHQFYMAHLYSQTFPMFQFGLPIEILKYCKKRLLIVRDDKTSLLELNILNVMKNLFGRKLVQQYFSKITYSSIDFAVPDHKLLFFVNGPTHYVPNTRELYLAERFLHEVLENSGFVTVPLCYLDIKKKKNKAELEAYIIQETDKRIQRHLKRYAYLSRQTQTSNQIFESESTDTIVNSETTSSEENIPQGDSHEVKNLEREPSEDLEKIQQDSATVISKDTEKTGTDEPRKTKGNKKKKKKNKKDDLTKLNDVQEITIPPNFYQRIYNYFFENDENELHINDEMNFDDISLYSMALIILMMDSIFSF